VKHFTDQRGYHDALDELADVVRNSRQIDGGPQNAAISRRSYELRSPATLFENIQRASPSGHPDTSPLRKPSGVVRTSCTKASNALWRRPAAAQLVRPGLPRRASRQRLNSERGFATTVKARTAHANTNR
jgi:hypothetical protein